MKKKLFVILMFFGISSVCFSQQTNDLTQEELEAFKAQCLERVDAFQMGLEIIADKRQSSEIRNHYINTIPEMFIGNGNPWTDNKGGKHDAVKMQVSSLSTGQIKSVPLKQYLVKLRDLPYKYVEIKQANTCLISNFYKTDDGKYQATCTFFQYFTGQSGETIVIRDETQKAVDVSITRVDDGSLGTYWDMKFGDIDVTETKKGSNEKNTITVVLYFGRNNNRSSDFYSSC